MQITHLSYTPHVNSLYLYSAALVCYLWVGNTHLLPAHDAAKFHFLFPFPFASHFPFPDFQVAPFSSITGVSLASR